MAQRRLSPCTHPAIVSRGSRGGTRRSCSRRKRPQTRARDALAAERRRMPWMAVREGVTRSSGHCGHGEPASTCSTAGVSSIVYRAFFEPGVLGCPSRPAGGCSHGGRRRSPTSATCNARRHHARRGLARARPNRAAEGAHGLADAVVHASRDSFDARLRRATSGTAPTSFYRDGDRVFRTYFVNSCGDEQMGCTWNYSDITLLRLGRRSGRTSPEGYRSDPDLQAGGTGTTATCADAAPDRAGVEVVDRRRGGVRNQGAREP